MSWIKRRGQGASPNPSSAPPVQMYNPNPHSNLQSQWQQQDLQPPASNWYNHTQPNQQPPAFGQTNYPPQQEYWMQNFNQPTTENAYNEHSNQQYSQYDQKQPNYTTNNHQVEQMYFTNTPNHVEPPIQPQADTTNWGWGDEDNSNVQNLPLQNTNSNQPPVDTFGGDDRWNWTVEDSNTNSNIKENLGVENRQEVLFPKMGKMAEKYVEPARRDDQKDNVGYASSSLNQLPLLKPKSKLDTLTPQWSTESQVSQDSSDVLHTSESDKSHMLSRSSTISESPISGQDVNLELNQQELHLKQFLPPQEELPGNYYRQNYSTQHENKEVLSSVQDEPKLLKPHPTPPPSLTKNQTPPLLPPPIDEPANTYKRVGPLSHKTTTKYSVENQQQSFYSSQPYYPPTNNPFTQTVNLETLPDNSEQPDSLPQPNHLKKINSTKPIQQWPENNEAPINDRNQYLETGQLSNNDYDQSVTENSDLLPPPSFPRMVLGQLEQSDANNQDEPPPGLSRMVLGETVANEPPVGLHRMVPGESSSPKVQTVVRPPNEIYQNYNRDDNNSDSSTIQVRSATIGGDIDRSETIGADLSPYNSSSADNNHVHSTPTGYNNNVRETNVDGANNLDESTVPIPPVIDRRDSIEGEPQNTSIITNLVSSVRNLAIGDVAADSAATTQSERQSRKLSRQESTDSEKEHESHRKQSKERSERRYPDKHDRYDRDKGRRRYTPSPDDYRKKYERRRYKDKRYDDDTDYYSDKEKLRKKDDRERLADYEKKYSSLKRDKDKERGRREHRSHRDYAGRDPPRRNEYYNRYGEEYDDQTRPSSRSDSMHDSYRQDRDRHRDRDKDRHRRNRDPFSYNNVQGYAYDPYHPYYQQYHYYENLRRTNPQAYAEWYRKYYQQSGMQQTYGPEDRASVHSGRSSANDESAKDRYTRQSYYSQASLNYYREPNPQSVSGHYGLDESRQFDQTDTTYLEDTTIASHRLTPAKFSTAHIKASITSGHLVKVFPNYPLDGQKATVEIGNLHELLSNDDEYKELVEFPGPLVKGVTHKKTIIEYCESKIRNAICNRDIADVDSYILLWELLILLLRQNGMVVGTDVAELLMKDRKQERSRRASVGSNASSAVGEAAGSTPISETNASSTSIVKDEAVTNKFREYLIYGSGKEALEWAMKHNLWGHAFFLASKLDKRTYANVMTRFANGISLNDPLQTLYQLLSGKVPVMCTADEKWGDWKPHLAMILSNTSSRPDIDSKSIATLGDTLLGRGNLYAAQFCYLMAHVGFGCYGNEEAKLVLLGANHNKTFLEFALNEAIHMTEVYEYAISLNDSLFVIPEFQPYKYVLATRLADRGLLEKALLYLEKVSYSILQNPSLVQLSLISQVCQLADRLKYCDPVEESFEGDLDTSRPDNSWLKDLKAIEEDYNKGLIRQESVESSHVEPIQQDLSQPVYDQPLEQENLQKAYAEPQYQQPWQNVQQPFDYQPVQGHLDVGHGEQYQEHPAPTYWPNQPQWNEAPGMETNDPPSLQDHQSQNDYWNSSNAQKEEVEKQPDEVTSAPQIDENDNTSAPTHKQDSPAKNKSNPIQPSSGWFTKIFNVIPFRPKNQMHLPDDTNPSIVYDEKRKAWINKEEGDEPIVKAKVLPPPTMADMMPKMGQPVGMATKMLHQNFNPIPTEPNHMNNNVLHNQYPSMVRQQEVPQQSAGPVPLVQQPAPSLTNDVIGMPARSNQPNMFKLDKSRNMKKAYVDILNPGARNANATSSITAPDNFGLPATNGTHLNYFVPAPVNDPNAPMDFLSHGMTQLLTDNTQMSRWSSASSLSREVQFYMQPKPARR